MTGFGERLKEARGNESQASFAKKLGVTQVAYSRYEANVREPNLEMLYQIGIITGISTDWLLGLSDNLSTAVDKSAQPTVNAPNNSGAIAIGGGNAVSRDCLECPLLKDHLKRFSKPR